MRRTPRFTAVAGVAVLAVAAGCGGSSGNGNSAPNPNAAEVSPAGDIPDNQAFVAYTPPGEGFSVKVPEGWARTGSGGAVNFTDKLNVVRVDSAPAGAPLTVARARGTELTKLRQTVKGLTSPKVQGFTRKGGSGVLITYLADGKPDPVTGKTRQSAVQRYVFFHNRTRVTLTLSGAKGADNVDPWRIVSDSLRWTS